MNTCQMMIVCLCTLSFALHSIDVLLARLKAVDRKLEETIGVDRAEGGYLEMSLHVSCLKPIPYRNARSYLFNRSSMFYSARSPVLDPEGDHEGDRHSSLVHLSTRRYSMLH